MSTFNCVCPEAAAITALTPVTCGENILQVVKYGFQRAQAAAPFPTQDATAGGAALLASWTALKAAVDATKIQFSPQFCESLVIPPIEAITEGGDDNSTVDGIENVIGAGNAVVIGMFRSIPGSALLELKAYNCELNLTIYLVNENGQVIGHSEDGTTFEGIPIDGYFIGDGGNEGKNTEDKTSFRWSFRYGWRDKLAYVTGTDFNGRDL